MTNDWVAQSYEDVIKNVGEFNKSLDEGKDLQGSLSFFRAWYYIPELDAVGPSKFIGYKDMTAGEYVGRYKQDLDGRETESVLKQWFEVLEGDSPKDKYVAAKVEQLLQRYDKRPSKAFRCGAPPSWRLGSSKSPIPPVGTSSSKVGGGESPLVEVFWRGFLSLYPEDQDVLARRIIAHRKVSL